LLTRLFQQFSRSPARRQRSFRTRAKSTTVLLFRRFPITSPHDALGDPSPVKLPPLFSSTRMILCEQEHLMARRRRRRGYRGGRCATRDITRIIRPHSGFSPPSESNDAPPPPPKIRRAKDRHREMAAAKLRPAVFMFHEPDYPDVASGALFFVTTYRSRRRRPPLNRDRELPHRHRHCHCHLEPIDTIDSVAVRRPTAALLPPSGRSDASMTVERRMHTHVGLAAARRRVGNVRKLQLAATRRRRTADLVVERPPTKRS
jgi:hypothetical protein